MYGSQEGESNEYFRPLFIHGADRYAVGAMKALCGNAFSKLTRVTDSATSHCVIRSFGRITPIVVKIVPFICYMFPVRYSPSWPQAPLNSSVLFSYASKRRLYKRDMGYAPSFSAINSPCLRIKFYKGFHSTFLATCPKINIYA